jgi:2-keto-4-pentenoate hydratase/2-oxohepta-3-ene-1,7-dioic acid hydratase in catechol pathway
MGGLTEVGSNRFRVVRRSMAWAIVACLPGFLGLAAWAGLPLQTHAAEIVRYVRYEREGATSYGLLEGDEVRRIDGSLFEKWQPTSELVALSEVRLLPPTQPTQVLAMAGNYRSHLDDKEIPPKFRTPQPFFKSPSCLIGQGESIVIPADAREVDFEAELVVVIGKKCRRISREDALDYVFGVTAGNDVSERIWQNDAELKDVQWWRAKGADTFGPVGPVIVSGIDYGNLLLRLRLNGEVKQEERTDHLIHDIPTIISHISRYVTLYPGDLIFTGTPGQTSSLKPGDVVEVELEGVGVLRNPVVVENP